MTRKCVKNSLLREMGVKCLQSLLLFGVVLLLAWGAEQIWDIGGQILKWSDGAFAVSIPASVFGVAYVLTVKNPNNYFGFFLGILMALLLALQFFLQDNLDLVFLYLAVFIPIYIVSINKWKKGSDDKQQATPFLPIFLSSKQQWLTLLTFLLIVAIDYLLVTFLLFKNGMTDDICIKILSGSMIASSIIANYWMIYKKVDTWAYWVIYSIAGLLLNILITNIFSIILFLVFAVINTGVFIEWIKIEKANL